MPANIDFQNIDFPNKEIFHKMKDDNVHIYNLRRILPRIVNANDFENDILSKITQDEKEFLLTHYAKRNLQVDNKTQYFYILRSLPFKISIKDMENFLSDEAIKDDARDYILHFYSKNRIEGYYVLNDFFNDEFEEHKIAKIFKTRILLITDKEKVRISNLLETSNKIGKKDIFYANMHIYPNHPYFFEHKLDHIPGLMAIETARQMVTACAHIYGKVPTTGVFFTLKNVEVTFKEYLWLSFPTRIKLEMLDTTYTKDKYWFKSECKVTFYQEFREKAVMRLSGMTIKMDLLERITTKKQVEAALEFNAHPGLQSDIVIHEQKNDMNYIGTIVDISPKHFMVEFIEEVDLNLTDNFDFKISLDNTFTAYGSCQLRIIQRKGNRSIANFLITDIDVENSKNINEIVMRLCHIREQRGIL